MASSSSRSHPRFASLLSVAGWVLIGSSASSVLFASFPIQLGQPNLYLRFSAAILSASSFLLVGSVLVCGAALLDVDSKPLKNRQRWLRRAAGWFAIMLIVVVPIQFVAGYSVISSLRSAERESLKQRRQVMLDISRIQTEDQLRNYVSSLPDRPQLPAKFDAAFPVIKQRVLGNLSSGYKVAESQLKIADTKRLFEFVGQLVKNIVQSLLMAFAFWSFRSPVRDQELKAFWDRLSQ